MTDVVYAKVQALFATTPTQAESLLNSLGQTAGSIGLNMK